MHQQNRVASACLAGFSLCAALILSGIARAQEMPTAQGVEVVAAPIASPTPHDDWKAKLDHIMSEVSGTQITVTKKASVIKLEQQPTVVNNNQQELFTRAPGLLITEQNTPGQFNFSYRGLGNPQESEYVLALQDGLPISTDWIGFPTLYYLPLPQSVSEIELLRGGSSLLYGPEPAPAVNFIMRRPAANTPWTFSSEQVGGSDGLYSTFNVIQEATGPVEFRLDGGYVRTDGQRENSDYDLWQSNLYLGYRPDDKQLWAVDVHLSRFDGGDPGRLSYQQFRDEPEQATTPFNHNWVDRYSVVLRHDRDFGGGWFMQAKAWYAHQEIDSRALPFVQDEDFDNGGADIRFRKNWGEGTILKGSALTFGGVVYHGEAPFTQYINPDPTASRDSTAGILRLDQDRSSDYQAIFAENIFRFGKFHIVPSFRLDHESVDVDTNTGPFGSRSDSADHWVPLWGIGLGNDFGHLNETYFSASSGWRPTRFFDISSPFQNLTAANRPDPFHSLDIEAGVHGTPIRGLWYDLGLFWMEFENRTETQRFSSTEFVIVNSGTSRHRGFEGDVSYDFLAGEQPAPETTTDVKDVKQVYTQRPSRFDNMHLIVFSNLQLLDAEFTESSTGLVGNTPAFAPDVLWKGGITFRKDKAFDVSFTGIYASEQFWAEANTGTAVTPAKIPSYKVFNLSGDYYITRNLRLIAGISNLFDEKYYSRVFFNGSIEPAPRRAGYAGLALEF
ncbi:MAG: TonB-dependent receptor family protein [Chthoniobacterales bacterium]